MKARVPKQKCRHRDAADGHPCKAWAQRGVAWCWSHNPDQRGLHAHARLRRIEQGAARAHARLRWLEQERRIR